MAKITITIEDKEDSRVLVSADFDPAVDRTAKLSDLSDAQALAFALLVTAEDSICTPSEEVH